MCCAQLVGVWPQHQGELNRVILPVGSDRTRGINAAFVFRIQILYLHSAPTAGQGFITQEQSTAHHANRLLIRRTSSHPCSWGEVFPRKTPPKWACQGRDVGHVIFQTQQAVCSCKCYANETQPSGTWWGSSQAPEAPNCWFSTGALALALKCMC